MSQDCTQHPISGVHNCLSLCAVHAASSALRSRRGLPATGRRNKFVGIQSIAKISCSTSQAQGKSIQWAAWTNLCSINVAFQTLWQCLCSEKMVKTLLPPIITAVLLPLGKQCQSRKGAQLAVTREYVGECRMKGKTEIAAEVFLWRKGTYEERMRKKRWKMERGRKDEIFRKERRERREKKEEKNMEGNQTEPGPWGRKTIILQSMVLTSHFRKSVSPVALPCPPCHNCPPIPFHQHRWEIAPRHGMGITEQLLSARYNVQGWTLPHFPRFTTHPLSCPQILVFTKP